MLGEREVAETVEELATLQDDWFLGVEAEEGWGRSVQQEKANLWSLYMVKGEEMGASCSYRWCSLMSLLLLLDVSPPDP